MLLRWPYSRHGEKVSFFVAALANDSKAQGGATTLLILPLYAHKEPLGLMSFFNCARLNVVFFKLVNFLSIQTLVSHDYGTRIIVGILSQNSTDCVGIHLLDDRVVALPSSRR